MLLGAAVPATGQTGTITGVVVDQSGMQPLEGAQVSVVGTGQGVLADERGRFVIPGIPAGTHEVQVTFIGYRQQTEQVEVTGDGTAEVDFELGVSAVALDEVVVTGTAGEVERRKLGSSMASVDVSEVQTKMPLNTFSQVLQSRVPGVRSVGTVGGVGASSDLRIRGTSSFRLGQRPVIYIDGVRVDTRQTEWGWLSGVTCCFFSGGAGEDRLSDLNPSDIDRVEVLKGAAAATLYGSEASNGVIQIFTKSGQSDMAPRFTLGMEVGANRLRENLRTKLYPEFTGPDGFQAWDANEHLIETGLYQGYDLTVRGGGADVTYFISGAYSDEQGSVQPNRQRRGNLRVNLTWLPNEAWSFAVNTAYSRNRILALQSGNNWTSMLGNAVLGNPREATQEQPYGEPWVALGAIKEMETFADANRWTGGFTATFRPAQNFTHRLTFGLDNVTEQKERLLPYGEYYVYLGEVGERNIGYRTFRNFTMDYLGQYSIDLASSVQSEFSFGAQGFWETESRSMAVGKDYAGPGVTTVGGAANTFGDEQFQETVNIGIFAQNRFSIADKLFVTGGLRVDGNSAFGVNYGLQPYPKGDVSYLISREGFLPAFISNLKLRGAIGMAGMFPGAYDQFRTFSPTAVLDDVPGVTPANPGNPTLEPEKTTEMEAGFEAGLFEDRIGLDFTAFRSLTRDALLEVRLPPSEGFRIPQLRNVGEVMNVGWELGIDATALETRSVRWTTTLNLDGSRNEILDLGSRAEDGRLGEHREGHAVESLWGREPVDYDPETQTHTRSDTAVYQGPPLPTFNVSWGNTLNIGQFRIYGMVSAEQGAVFSNSDRPYRVRFRTGDEYLSTLGENQERTAKTDSLYDYFTLFNAWDSRDHIRIREASLSYVLPDGWTSALGVGNTTLTLSGQNLYWWDDCHCADPNMSYRGGHDFNFSGFLAMPQARKLVFSLRTRF